MEVLRPVLVNINGRIYRKNAVKEESYEEEDDYSYYGTGMEQFFFFNIRQKFLSNVI